MMFDVNMSCNTYDYNVLRKQTVASFTLSILGK